MDKKEITLVSVIDKYDINSVDTKAFTDIRKAEEYFRDLVGNELSRFYGDNDDDDKENDIDLCLECCCYSDMLEDGKRILISEIELCE